MPAVDHQFQILKQLGIKKEEKAFLEIWPSEKDEKYIKGFLESQWVSGNTRLVGINVTASKRWATKSWPVMSIAQLCDILAAKNIRVVLTGVEEDKYIVRSLLEKTKAKPIDCVGKTTILQLAALIKKCRVFVTPDSAPMHVAAATSTPFVALFGPTDPKRHMPPAKKSRVIYLNPECAPCYQTQCLIQRHICMKDITPQQVAQEIEELMK